MMFIIGMANSPYIYMSKNITDFIYIQNCKQLI
jgi:hypothetical protein